jgi:hypothetical protein
MGSIKKIVIIAFFSIKAHEKDLLSQIVPNIIVELASSHVYQKMTETNKIKCALIKDFLQTQTRYYLISEPDFVKSIENFAKSASDQNCQSILQEIKKILYGEYPFLIRPFPVDYNYIKSLLFSQQNNAEAKNYLESVITGKNCYSYQNIRQFDCKFIYQFKYIERSKNQLSNINLKDLLSQKIKDALAPSHKDDLKKLEIIYKFIIKKTAKWLINFKNLVK